MRWKTTVLVLIATIAVGSYVSLYELKQPTSEEQQTLKQQVVQVPPTDVTAFMVDLAGTAVTLGRRNGSWNLLSPRTGRADAALVQRILNQLDPLNAERVLEGTPDEPLALADFGLASPRGTLTVMAGSLAVKLAFGASTAVGNHHYVSLADTPKVFVVNAGLFDTLNQPIESYRSHELLVFETWKATEIRLVSLQTSYTLTMLTSPSDSSMATAATQGGRWQLTHPFIDEADSGAVSTTLSTFRGLRIERFVTEERQTDSHPEWGFETPSVRLTIAFDPSTPPLELLVGSPTTENPQHLYATRTDEPIVYAVAKTQIDALLHDPQTLRSRACFAFVPAQVTKLQRTGQEVSWTLEKRDGQWTVVDKTMALEAAKIDEWLWKLRDLKLTRFVDDAPPDLSRYGLAPPTDTIQVWMRDQQEPAQLFVGDVIGGGTTRYGRLSGRTSVVELPEQIQEFLNTTPEIFTSQSEQPAASAPPST